MGSKIFYRCFEVDDAGVSPQANPSRPPRGEKSSYTLPPARALRREGRPVRPWREAHSLSPCPDGQRQRLRTRKPDPIARVLHPRSDNTRCCPADSSWACPPRLPENRYILVQSTSKADGQVRPAGVVQMCPPESRMPDAAHLPWNMKPGGRDGLPSAGSPYHVGVKDAAENQRNGVVKKSVPVTVVLNIRQQRRRGEPQARPSRPPLFIRSQEPARRVPSFFLSPPIPFIPHCCLFP